MSSNSEVSYGFRPHSGRPVIARTPTLRATGRGVGGGLPAPPASRTPSAVQPRGKRLSPYQSLGCGTGQEHSRSWQRKAGGLQTHLVGEWQLLITVHLRVKRQVRNAELHRSTAPSSAGGGACSPHERGRGRCPGVQTDLEARSACPQACPRGVPGESRVSRSCSDRRCSCPLDNQGESRCIRVEQGFLAPHLQPVRNRAARQEVAGGPPQSRRHRLSRSSDRQGLGSRRSTGPWRREGWGPLL